MKLPNEEKKGRFHYKTTYSSAVTTNNQSKSLGIDGSIKTLGGDLLIIIDIPISITATTAFVNVKIDNKEYEILKSDYNNSSEVLTPVQTASAIINNIAKGTHSLDITFRASASGQTAKINSYKTVALTAIEL